MSAIVLSTPLELHKLAEEGVTVADLKTFMQRFSLTQKQMASLLGLSDKTLFNLLKKDMLDVATSDRFLLVQSIFQEGVEALMSEQTFRQWLEKPHTYFNRRTPLEMMATINGAEAVRDELIRTKHGILS